MLTKASAESFTIQFVDTETGTVIVDHDTIHATRIMPVKEHEKALENRNGGRILATTSNENLFFNKPVVVYTRRRLYHAIGEEQIVEHRPYAMVIVRHNGSVTITIA